MTDTAAPNLILTLPTEPGVFTDIDGDKWELLPNGDWELNGYLEEDGDLDPADYLPFTSGFSDDDDQDDDL